ncbi:metalloregulator ArsR/SmtB family transcription factor [Corynebacterium felinum]|uniref:DNA-binding transcriptional ArsR family regulator n=1 Tax=Corynebacterium felinum TaxID=131318 RepID=A0ABU2B7U6_9CORY|nr:metalloregulator ArsR/SmtB family transcription factor [Corynebacterium felinum]MDF5820266.1 metalloregulator ArsR/SmtB family transcription factor [Corynebacterium felinum]MDR7353464.1 DNA-binding transcriptional ArsR family regulator [Corynebacterium felinum]WJY95644.1 HTH-type transcriptional repressor SmtB [Corynebacterium felinum]
MYTSETPAPDPFAPPQLANVAEFFKALDSPIRLQIIHILSTREHYVYEIVEKLNSSQPLISQHLRVLRETKIVDCTRSGRLITYKLACPGVLGIINKDSNACHAA